MTETDSTFMKDAIAMAEQCKPMADRIPKVGAIIAVGSTVIGRGHRGTGAPNDDDHAEKNALASIADRRELPKATVYTTLEPCTPEVRSDPLNCCTELIRQAEVKTVFIGILDPNQGVRGKGLWELQSRGIGVELFPPDLARQIRVINDRFIREQQTLGLRITNVNAGDTIKTYDRGGTFEFQGTFLNPPGNDVFAFTNVGGRWWPQPYSLQVTGPKTWSVKVHFGNYEPHTVAIVRANELGVGLIEYYRKITAKNRDRRNRVAVCLERQAPGERDPLLGLLGEDYPSIEMARLPKGIELQFQVEVLLESPPNGPK